MKNPFELSSPLSAREILGRSAELDRIRQTATRSGRLFVRGHRGAGKTGLLEAAIDHLRGQGIATCIPVSLTEMLSVRQILEAILRGASALSDQPKNAPRWLSKHFGYLNPRVGFDESTATVTRVEVRPDRDDNPTDFDLLIQTLSMLDALLVKSKKPAALFIDDIEELKNFLSEEEGRGYFESLRGLTHLAVIIAGRPGNYGTEGIYPDIDTWFETIDLQDLLLEDWAPFVENGLGLIGCSVKFETLLEITRLGTYSPRFTLRPLAKMWEHLARKVQPIVVSPEDFRNCVDSCVSESDPYYRAIWRNLTLPQRRVLEALVSYNGENLLSHLVLSKIDMAAGTMQRSLQSLESQGLVFCERVQKPYQWRMTEGFFEKWLKM